MGGRGPLIMTWSRHGRGETRRDLTNLMAIVWLCYGKAGDVEVCAAPLGWAERSDRSGGESPALSAGMARGSGMRGTHDDRKD
jgi:hypothetical protein